MKYEKVLNTKKHFISQLIPNLEMLYINMFPSTSGVNSSEKYLKLSANEENKYNMYLSIT